MSKFSSKFVLFDEFGRKVITIDNNTIVILIKILTSYPKLKTFGSPHYRTTILTGKNNLMTIGHEFRKQKLKSLDISDVQIDVSEDEVEEFSKLIEPQLIECVVAFGHDDKQMFLVKQLKDVEVFKFDDSIIQQSKQVF